MRTTHKIALVMTGMMLMAAGIVAALEHKIHRTYTRAFDASKDWWM